MPRTDFYLLKSSSDADMDANEHTRLLTACRIIEKAYVQSHKIYIFCTDKKQAEILDKLLWDFKDISFIPHAQNPNTSDAPVLIGDSTSPPPEFCDILINLADAVPDFFKHFQRIIEVIPENSESRQKAREKYRFYREQQCELHSHNL